MTILNAQHNEILYLKLSYIKTWPILKTTKP